LSRPVIKPHTRRSGCSLGLGELPKILRFPYNISAKAEASDFKIGTQLVFAKAHHEITHRRKSGCSPGLGELPKIWRFLFILCATAEASNFKFGMQLRFAKAYHKIIPRGKVGVALG